MDKIYVNGIIHSLDHENNDYEAMAIKDGLICELGSNEDILKLKTDTTKIYDLHNQVVFPGFNDSHMHILEYAIQAERIDLSHVKSIDELILVMKSALNEHSNNEISNATTNNIVTNNIVTNDIETNDIETSNIDTNYRGTNNADSNSTDIQWLIGRCMNQDHFKDKRMPTKDDLNKISTTIPIVILRVCHHIAVVNDKALELLSSNGVLPAVEGGEFLLGKDGKPNGILTENALQLIYNTLSKPSVSKVKELILKTTNEMAAHGITSAHSDDFASVEHFEDVITAYRELGEENLLKVRVNQQCLIKDSKELLEFIHKGYASKVFNPYYSLGALKILSDGSLGARTAYLRNPYHDEPSTRGVFVETKEQLLERMKLADDNGMQIAVHAIGDGAIEAIFDCFQELDAKNNYRNPLRHGIVHCQITDKELLERFNKQNILAYIQPIFLEYDLHMVEDRVGKELASTSYAFKTLMDSGVHTSGGSDCPVEHFNIMNNIYCGVARKDLFGQPVEGFHVEEALTMRQALQAFTMEGAYASREEQVKGSLEKGKYADFVVLDKDLLQIENEEIRNVNVLMTVMGGKTTYRNENFN